MVDHFGVSNLDHSQTFSLVEFCTVCYLKFSNIQIVCHSYQIPRPVSGKDQVMVGLVPINTPFSSSQSSKAVFPLAIANCKETRLV